MSLLQYTSKEMFSSTELIRKSKMVFDKLNANEIEKAIILRDGKPSFLLLDFEKYETIMTEYLELKEQVKELKKTNRIVDNNKKDIKKDDDISENDLEIALAKIEELDLRNEENKEKQPLKDFWE